MNDTIEWRIYYDDGTTFSNLDGSPEEAPPFGFICAVGYDETNSRYIMHGWDHYCWDVESNQWWGMDTFGLIDRLSRNLIVAYKQGRTVSKTRFTEIMNLSNDDINFINR